MTRQTSQIARRVPNESHGLLTRAVAPLAHEPLPPRKRLPVAAIARHTVLILVAIACLLPFLYSVMMSFKTQLEIIAIPPTLWPEHWSLDSYRELFNTTNFGPAFLNTVFYASISTLAALLAASAAGYVFAKYRFRFKQTLFGLLLATAMIPFGAVLVPLYLIVSSVGWLNTYQGVIVPTIITTFGIFLMRQFIEAIPDELIEAARLDRASESRIFFSIILPLVGPGMVVLGALHFLAIWDSFIWPLAAISDQALNNLPLTIATLASEQGPRYDLQIAASVLTNLPILIGYAVVQRRITQGIAMTGGKL